MPETKLSRHHKIFIVTQLAVWERPTIIRNQLKEIYGIEVTLPAICNYDGDKPGNPKKWRELFTETRQEFVKNTAAIPIANKAFRLRELDNLYHNQKLANAARQNPAEMRAALEQAAKEDGNYYSNRTELTGKGGKPLIPETSGPQVVVYLPDNGRGDADVTPGADPDAIQGPSTGPNA
jgi:hypothetical protein